MTVKQVIVLLVAVIILIWHFKSKAKMPDFEAKKRAYLQALEQSPLYRNVIASAIFNCVRANYTACSLECPVNLANHLIPWGKGVGIDKNGRLLFCYKFKRSIICPGGGKIQYSTMPVQDMVIELNQSFPNYCIQNGWNPMYIVGFKNGIRGQVFFYVAPFNSWNDVDNYLRSIGYII